MYPLAIGTVVSTKRIWDELNQTLQASSLRSVFELSELPDDWAVFQDRIDRVRPDVILLEITNLREPLDQVVARIRETSAKPAVFALHTEADPNSILTALRAGVVEYLYPPLAEPLTAGLERLAAAHTKTQDESQTRGKAIAFISAKGGCGATTIASHVALGLAGLPGAKVLLADLDIQAGIIGFLFKTKSPYSVADAAHNMSRLDPSYWRALVSNGIPNLEIITAPITTDAKQITALQLKQVVTFARAQYGWTVLDLGRNLSPETVPVLESVDELYLVATHEVPALHQAKQIIQTLLNSGYSSSNLRLVLNRTPKHSDVTTEELEGMLGLPVYATLPNDYQILQDAYAEGRLLEESTTLGRSFTGFAKRIAGVNEIQKKRKFSLFG